MHANAGPWAPLLGSFSGRRLANKPVVAGWGALCPCRSATTIRKEWFLRGITGEPALPDLPTQPARQWGPETVVQAQLEALRCRLRYVP